MTRLFYDDAIDALYMAEKHGVKLQYVESYSSDSWVENIDLDQIYRILHQSGKGSYELTKLYIALESEGIFEAIEGDLVISHGNIRLLDKIGTVKCLRKDGVLFLEADYHDDASFGELIHQVHCSKAQIIQRNNTSFIMPIREVGGDR